jgi:hypothetical protein
LIGNGKIMSLEHSSGKHSTSVSTARIKILFATISPIQLRIKHAMKTSVPTNNLPPMTNPPVLQPPSGLRVVP